MTDPRDRESRPPAGAATRNQTFNLGPSLPRRTPARPDLFTTYPDPRVNYRPTLFGLPVAEYVAEVRRRQAEQWAAWEINRRFERPEVTP